MATESDRKSRGRSYPGHPLDETIGNFEVVYRHLGEGPFGRIAMAEAMGQKLSGSSVIKIAAMGHFGLTEQRSGVHFISDLGRTILHPRTDDEKRGAIATAAKCPTLYEELFDRFAGKPLPGMLANILTREFDVQASAAPRCAEIFVRSVGFAGLLKNGVLQREVPNGSDTASPVANGTRLFDKRESQITTSSPQPIAIGSSDQRVFIMPLAGRRSVSLAVPERLNQRDFELISQWLDLMQGALVDDESGVEGNNIEDEREWDRAQQRMPK
jgi:hypothetical protein